MTTLADLVRPRRPHRAERSKYRRPHQGLQERARRRVGGWAWCQAVYGLTKRQVLADPQLLKDRGLA